MISISVPLNNQWLFGGYYVEMRWSLGQNMKIEWRSRGCYVDIWPTLHFHATSTSNRPISTRFHVISTSPPRNNVVVWTIPIWFPRNNSRLPLDSHAILTDYLVDITWKWGGNRVEIRPKHENRVEITWMSRGYVTNSSLPPHFHEQSPHFDQVPRHIHVTSTENCGCVDNPHLTSTKQ